MYPEPIATVPKPKVRRRKPWFDRFKWGTLLLFVVGSVCTALAPLVLRKATTDELIRAAVAAALTTLAFTLNPKKADWVPDNTPKED